MICKHDIEAMYELQNLIVDRMSISEIITPSDLSELNRIGKVKLIDRGWEKCRDDTRVALLTDAHHFVRSCAVMKMAIDAEKRSECE